ncbi:nucleolar and spindle-associated protein 1 isoform X1 [Siniperca chuatsi]|uniref:nucleolar and spindle-associated protein 1 isoform X1 n=1 Tax=Siniperca chuatsi TaxID=119488 RepID=UPI001CE163FD|nr:nucleolar and spindle-associated protein 1 isoform X1 [Siniperca chuatsi]
MDLDSMKYAELRSLAKELGLKANMKADKLLKAIKQHYQQEKNKEEGGQGQEKDAAVVQEDENATQDSTQENKDTSCKEEVSSPTVFVNTRRGKGNGTKRKISDTASVTECDAKLPPRAAEGDTVAASIEPCGARGAKKRKVSSTKDSDKTEPPKEPQATGSEQQPDIKDEAPVHSDTENAPKVTKAGKIPRYQRLQQKNKPSLKPVTPNFKKLHEAHFNKMESIDSYVQRKTKQMDTYRSSVKELKKLSDKTKLQQVDGKTQVVSITTCSSTIVQTLQLQYINYLPEYTEGDDLYAYILQKANPSRASMFSPVLLNKRAAEDKRRHTLLSASKVPPNKPAGKEVVLFRPSVLSTRRINVRFSEVTHDNEHKRSLLKTPARMSPCVTSSTPQKPTADGGKPKNVKTSTFSATKTPGPFIFTGNTSTSTTPGTQKSNFDLKASLSRPLTYKPHTGKLKPFGEAKENTAGNKSLISNSHQKNYKQHQVQTRGDRRAKQTEDRKQKKESMLGARRGLVMM